MTSRPQSRVVVPAGDQADGVVADPGTIAGRYQIIERIGEGGMGQVLQVRHLRLDKLFALKLMHAEYSLDEAALALFEREAELTSTLAHPNIVSVVDFGEDPDWGLFLVMELVEGETLRHQLSREKRLKVVDASRLVEQLADALAHSHANDIVHGDIKPDNIVCIEDPEQARAIAMVKLLDFGAARIATGIEGREQILTGTPEYLAPERIMGNPPSPSNDIYALGTVLYELLTGSVPFTSGDASWTLVRHLDEEPEEIVHHRDESIDPQLQAIVSRAMAKHPEERYASAELLRDDLRTFLARVEGATAAWVDPPRPSHETASRAAADAFLELGLPACGVDAKGNVVIANRRFATLWGATNASDVIGLNVLRTKLASAHRGLREDVRRVSMDGQTVRRRLHTRRGTTPIELELLMTPATGHGGSCMLVIHPIGS